MHLIIILLVLIAQFFRFVYQFLISYLCFLPFHFHQLYRSLCFNQFGFCSPQINDTFRFIGINTSRECSCRTRHYNAYSQAKAIANNALIIFEREIARIESIPQNVTDMQGELNYKNIPDLPIRILRSYKTLIGSSVHYDLKNPEVADFIHINAYRTADEKIHFTQPDPCCNYCHPDSAKIIKSAPNNGYWIYSEVNHCKTIALCHLIHNSQHQPCGILKVDFPF